MEGSGYSRSTWEQRYLVLFNHFTPDVERGISPMQVLITHDHVYVPEWSCGGGRVIDLSFCLFALS